jgi:hypothetical protein
MNLGNPAGMGAGQFHHCFAGFHFEYTLLSLNGVSFVD